MGKMLQTSWTFLDRTIWTNWVTAIALVAFGFCLRDFYEQWRFANFARTFATNVARTMIRRAVFKRQPNV